MKYRVQIVLCSNAETLLSSWGEDPTGNGWADEAHQVVRATRDAIRSVPAPACITEIDDEIDSHFANWNGGKYAEQAEAYGWDITNGLGAVRVYAIEPDIDEYGDELNDQETRLAPADCPHEIRHWFDLVNHAALLATETIEYDARNRIRDAAIEYLCECAENAVNSPDAHTLEVLAKAAAGLRSAVSAM